MSECRVNGPTFYNGMVSAARYMINLLCPFFAKLRKEEKLYGFFQQDSTTPHMVHITFKTLQEVFSGWILRHRLGSPHSS
jgi:hypothetical protein